MFIYICIYKHKKVEISTALAHVVDSLCPLDIWVQGRRHTEAVCN